MSSPPAISVLYIVYWGAAEPLGRSLVLPSVTRLADLGVRLTLATFEKPADLRSKPDMAGLTDYLRRHGIAWIPLRYHKRPKVPATLLDLANGWARAILASVRNRPDIIHARTFVGGLIGRALQPVLRGRLIYHNEGFYPDEQVDAGVWRAGSAPHRLAGRLEQDLYSHADAVIAVSDRGKKIIDALPEVRRKGTPVVVVPSCVDLEHFKAEAPRPATLENRFRFVYAGSVGGRYPLDRVARFTQIAGGALGHVTLTILTRAEPELVSSLVKEGGLESPAWSLAAVTRDQMPGALASHDAGIAFLSSGLGEHGGSPTKIGEYWAMGLPVVTTPNIGDIDAIIHRHQVGVIVKEHNDAEYRRAAEELARLLNDPSLKSRCREAAEIYYALASACDRQLMLYQLVTRGPAAAAGTHNRGTVTAP